MPFGTCIVPRWTRSRARHSVGRVELVHRRAVLSWSIRVVRTTSTLVAFSCIEREGLWIGSWDRLVSCRRTQRVRSRLLLLVACLALSASASGAVEEGVGSIIASGERGSWLVAGRRARALGVTTGASYSSDRAHIVVTTRTGIRVLDRHGVALWRRTEAFLAVSPRFSRTGPARIAFIAGNRLRVIDSDGQNEKTIAVVRGVAPAWRPGGDSQELAFVNAQGGLEIVDARGMPSTRWTPPPRPLVSVCWSGDGEHLVAVTRYSMTVLSPTLEPRWVRRYRHAALINASCSPRGNQLAVLRVRDRSPPGKAELLSSLRVASSQTPEQTLLIGDRFSRPVWIDDDKRLLVGDVHGWVSVPLRGGKPRRFAAPVAAAPIASSD